MSLAKTLMKVVIGVAIAKGVSSLTKGASASTTGAQPSAGRGTRYDGQNRGGLEDIMGEVLGGGRTDRSTHASEKRAPEKQADSGSLGDLLEQISGQKKATPRKTAPTGGLDDLLGQLTGKSGAERTTKPAEAGGVGDLLEMVMGGRKPGGPVELTEPGREEEVSAALMLRAVLQAVRCDGELDAEEKARLMQSMGEADASEIKAVNAELARPVDIEGLARSVPAGLEPRIYAMSLMAIDLDNQAEAKYLHALAQALDLSQDQVNALHDRAKAPRLYR